MGQKDGWLGLAADLPPLLYHTLQFPPETLPLKSVDQEFASCPHWDEEDEMAVAEEGDEMRRAGQEDSP